MAMKLSETIGGAIRYCRIIVTTMIEALYVPPLAPPRLCYVHSVSAVLLCRCCAVLRIALPE